MKKIFVVSFLAGALAAIPAAAGDIEPVETDIPAGAYTLDKTHASLIFRVSHLGFSMYTARFTRFDATLDLDPDAPESASLTARVEAASIETDFPVAELDVDFDETLRGEDWLETDAYPHITFTSTDVEMTGPDTAKVTGDVTLHGVTKPLALDVVFNGGYAENDWDPMGARIGFSATGELNRADFGVDYGLPEEGSDFGVGDRVEIVLETEFVKPEGEAAE